MSATQGSRRRPHRPKAEARTFRSASSDYEAAADAAWGGTPLAWRVPAPPLRTVHSLDVYCAR